MGFLILSSSLGGQRIQWWIWVQEVMESQYVRNLGPWMTARLNPSSRALCPQWHGRDVGLHHVKPLKFWSYLWQQLAYPNTLPKLSEPVSLPVKVGVRYVSLPIKVGIQLCLGTLRINWNNWRHSSCHMVNAQWMLAFAISGIWLPVRKGGRFMSGRMLVQEEQNIRTVITIIKMTPTIYWAPAWAGLCPRGASFVSISSHWDRC